MLAIGIPGCDDQTGRKIVIMHIWTAPGTAIGADDTGAATGTGGTGTADFPEA